MFRRSGNYVAGRLQCQICPFCPLPPPALRRNYGLQRQRYTTEGTASATAAEVEAEATTSGDVKPEDSHPRPRSRRKRLVSRRLPLPVRKTPLGVNTLGKPGHVIVIPRRSNRSNRRRQPPKVESEAGQNMLWKNVDEVLEEVNKSRVALSAEAVIANFNDLGSRHKPGEKLQRPEWNRLRNSLCNGFTGNQLLGYMKYLQRQDSEVASDRSAGETVEDAQWRPGTSIFLELKGDTRTVASSTSAFRDIQGKVVLAEIIMRRFWKLSIRDEIGRIDMHIDPAIFFTLLRSRTEPLASLKESCADDVHMEIWHIENTVSITGHEERCIEIREGIDDLIAGVRSMEVDLSRGGSVFGVDDQQLQDDFVDMLRREYDVFCTRKDDQTMALYCTGDADIENALRSIDISVALPFNRTAELTTYISKSEPATMYPFMTPLALSWPDRQSEWVRWAKPFSSVRLYGGRLTARPPDSLYSKRKDCPLSEISRLFFFERGGGDLIFDNDKKYLREIITASVGICVFKSGPSLKAGDETPFSRLANTDVRAFAPNIPHALPFFERFKQMQSADDENTCRIRLLPSPKNKALFPPVELELNVSPRDQFLEADVIPTITRASIVIDEINADTLLPDTTVDVRFTKATHYDLFGGRAAYGEAPNHESPIISKLHECVTNFPARYPLVGPQPKLPPFCSLLIPKRFARSGGGREAESINSNNEFLEAEYIVPPIECLTASRIAQFKFKDFPLEFSSPSMGPVLPHRTTNISLSLGRYDDEIRPLSAFPNQRLSSLDPHDNETVGSLSYAFKALTTRVWKLAFKLGASGRDFQSSSSPGQSNMQDSGVDSESDSDWDADSVFGNSDRSDTDRG